MRDAFVELKEKELALKTKVLNGEKESHRLRIDVNIQKLQMRESLHKGGDFHIVPAIPGSARARYDLPHFNRSRTRRAYFQNPPEDDVQLLISSPWCIPRVGQVDRFYRSTFDEHAIQDVSAHGS